MNDDERCAAETALADLLAAGLEYQARGWHVFATTADKRPARNCDAKACRAHALPDEMRDCECLTCHGPYAATLDLQTLARQLEAVAGQQLEEGREPIATLSLATGAVSDVLVVDLDPTPERPLMKLRAEVQPLIRPTKPPGARTPRGGLHLYFSYPSQRVGNSVGLLAPGIDVRSDGGFVVLPPSAGRYWMPNHGLDDHALQEAPARLVAKLNRPRVDRPPAKDWETGAQRGQLRSLCAFVERSPAGERNNSLHWAANRAREEVEAGLYLADNAMLMLAAAAERVGLNHREAMTVINRALRLGNE